MLFFSVWPQSLRRDDSCVRFRVATLGALFLLSSLAAHAAAPAVTLSTRSLTFATQTKGTVSPPQSVTLTNTGNASLTITTIRTSVGFFQTNTCTASLAAGATCTISVTFGPQANGTTNGNLSITDNATGSPQAVSLTGTATVGSLSPASVNFGSQNVGTTTAPQTVTLSNLGQSTLKVNAITFAGTNPSDFSQTNTCTTIALGSSCTINVSFTASASGSRSATLNVIFSSAVSPIPATLTGTGNASAVSLSPTSLTFATQTVGTTSPAQTVSVSNSGTASLAITSIAATLPYAQTNNCGTSLAIGASCSVSVTFSPTTSSAQSGALTLTDNAAGSPQSATLNGTGAASAVTLAPTSLTFGNQALATSSPPQSVILTNIGGVTLNISGISVGGANPGDFLQSNNCGSSVTAGGSCTITVQFQPAALGSRTASLLITDDVSGSPQSVPLSGSSPSAVPFVQQPLSPQVVAPGGAAPTVTVNGAGFSSASSVLWNGSTRTTTYVSPTQLKVSLQGSDVATAATGRVAVSNPTPGGGVSNSQTFQVSSPASAIAMGGMTLHVGQNPRGIVVADFNGDGKPDVATVNRNSGTVSVMLGNGDGSFGAAASFATGADPTDLTAADIDGDGKLDIVTANRASYTISVLRGNGDGTFAAHTDYPAGTEAIAVTAADFNRDGMMDVAAANSADNTISIFLRRSDGTLQPQVTYSTGSSPIAVVVGDFNADGIVDIAAADSGSNNVAILFGKGDGTFQNAIFYPVGPDPDGLLAADLNGDGKLDLVTANNGNNTISVLINNGTGTFTQSVQYAVGTLPFGVVAGDFYSNGKIDIAVVNLGDNTVSILPGNGDGTFSPQATLAFSTGEEPIALAAGDLNLDGRADLVVSNSDDNTVSVLVQSPTVSLSSSSLAFGSQNIGSSSVPQNVIITNTGSANLSITSIALTGVNGSQYSQTNNCSALASGASCTVTVTFAPTLPGSSAANLTITDNAADSPQNVSLLGTGVAPVLTLSPGALTFNSQVVGSTSAAQAVTLTNAGNIAASITSIVASANFGQTNTCGSSVASGAACTINVTFTPSVTGTLTGNISVTDNVVGSPQVISLSGTGMGAPAVALSPTSLTFTSQSVDTTSAAKSVTLTNNGSGSLTITSIATTGAFSQTNNCPGSMAVGTSCTLNVQYTPTSVGTASGSVSITDNASNSPQTLALSGTGSVPTVVFAPSSGNFGNQNVNVASAAKGVKLTNNTGARLTFTKIATSPNYSQNNNCSAGVASGASCNIAVTFTPTTTGSISGTLTITDSATNSPQTVPLTGTGIAASVVLSPTSVAFANQSVGTSTAPSVVTLTNTGTAALSISAITITGTNAGDFSQTSNCGTSLAAGAGCTINAVFTPTVTGARSANISVADNAAGSPQIVTLSGTGTAPTAALSPSGLTFSNQAVGSSSTAKTVTLSNSGTAALTITSIGITGLNPTDFSQTNNCGTSLAASTSCAINVIFTPTISGSRQANVSVSDNVSGSPQIAALTGTGTASTVAFSTSAVTFQNQPVGTTSASAGITLFNTGNATLTITSVTVAGTNPGDFSQSNTCGTSLSNGASCTINVSFTPTIAAARSAAISVSDNATGSPQSVTLVGTGTSGGPSASISTSSLTFAVQNIFTISPQQAITLTNPGAVSLNLINIVASGDFTQTNDCGSSVAPAATCHIQVAFAPSAAGSRLGYITLTDNDPTTQQTVTLNGTGSQPVTTVSISPVQASLTPGQTAQFQASISHTVTSNVTWAVDRIAGGNSTVGTVSSIGIYTAPPTAGSHLLTATSTADNTQTASVPVVVTSYAGTFVYHNDDGRTGQNLNEIVLNTGNVNVNQFGKLFSLPVDGQTYAEPLYVQGVNIPGQGMHNVVYVATQNDSVYAYDADGANTTPLWKVNFLTSGAQTLNTNDIGGCSNISPQVGITSTPVIDPQTNTIYLVARTKIVSGATTSYHQTLHALDITTGLEMPNSPVEIQASISSPNGPIAFDPQMHNQRAGLFLNRGVVFIAWGAHCDIQPFHGWLMGYQEGTLQQVAVFNATPNGVEGGIWQSGAAPAVDEFGNIFATVGNGTTSVNIGGQDYSEGLLNLNFTGNSLVVTDYFLPSNFQTLNGSDLDLGSGGPMLLPTQPTAPTDLLIAAGKQGMVYLADRTNLGGYSATGNRIIQTLPANTVPTAHSMPAYWHNNVYFVGVGDKAKSYLLSNGLLSTLPTSQSTQGFGYPGATPAVSANGSANGILWVLTTVTGLPAQLHAYDATNISRELYNTGQNSNRDQPAIAAKFAIPTVANGKVYVGTQSEIDVYGLLP